MKYSLLSFFLLLFSLTSNAQRDVSRFDAFKYITVPHIKYKTGNDIYKLSENTMYFFKKKGFNIIPQNNLNDFVKKIDNLCEILTIKITHGTNNYAVNLKALDCRGRVIYETKADWSIAAAFNDGTLTHKDYLNTSLDQIFYRMRNLRNYSFKSNLTPEIKLPKAKYNGSPFNISDEESIKDYLDSKRFEPIEGIWKINNALTKYTLLILKEEQSYKIYLLNSEDSYWKNGELKGTIQSTATNDYWEVNWTYFDKLKKTQTMGQLGNGVFVFSLENNIKSTLIKYYPKANNINPIEDDGGKWKGNGSGIIISKSGYIVTNHHVIKDVEDIEVEFIIDGEIQKFNAEVVQSDLRNDLAILKIVDANLDGFGTINYNFKTRSSDVGTKIYTFGYPKALSGMGKEIKVTEGIISSKSGIMGDITTYQITAPIQGGNSGGPLFDNKGNLIGINSSRFNSYETENVNYSIKSSYVLNLIDVLPKTIDLPSSTKLQSLPLTKQIKEISKYVVLVKVR
jgi:S1-C subfamily serine protease